MYSPIDSYKISPPMDRINFTQNHQDNDSDSDESKSQVTLPSFTNLLANTAQTPQESLLSKPSLPQAPAPPVVQHPQHIQHQHQYQHEQQNQYQHQQQLQQQPIIHISPAPQVYQYQQPYPNVQQQQQQQPHQPHIVSHPASRPISPIAAAQYYRSNAGSPINYHQPSPPLPITRNNSYPTMSYHSPGQPQNINIVSAPQAMVAPQYISQTQLLQNQQPPQYPYSYDPMSRPASVPQDRSSAGMYSYEERPFSVLSITTNQNSNDEGDYYLPNRFQCDKCPKSYTRKHNLVSHKLSVHEKEKMFKCDRCSVKFSRASDLSRHSKEQHSKTAKPFVCGGVKNDGTYWGCGKRFYRKDQLKSHLNTNKAGVRCKINQSPQAIAEILKNLNASDN